MRFGIIGVCLVAFAVTHSARAADLSFLLNEQAYSDYLYSSGQPTLPQFQLIAKAGVQVIVNLVPSGLPGSVANEAEIVRADGIKYFYIPVNWDRPTMDEVERFFGVMARNADKSVLVHCALNARASAFVFLYRTIKMGRPAPEEKKVLVAIWDKNIGYELKNVPVWQHFLHDASKTLK